jgi:hypothetical protein
MLFYHGRRNVTIVNSKLDIRVRYRYNGHVSLIENKMGLKTFFHKEFQQELNCILGFDVDAGRCPLPDSIILNSGLHDPHYTKAHVTSFRKDLSRFFSMLNRNYKLHELKLPRILWKGVYFRPNCCFF